MEVITMGKSNDNTPVVTQLKFCVFILAYCDPMELMVALVQSQSAYKPLREGPHSKFIMSYVWVMWWVG